MWTLTGYSNSKNISPLWYGFTAISVRLNAILSMNGSQNIAHPGKWSWSLMVYPFVMDAFSSSLLCIACVGMWCRKAVNWIECSAHMFEITDFILRTDFNNGSALIMTWKIKSNTSFIHFNMVLWISAAIQPIYHTAHKTAQYFDGLISGYTQLHLTWTENATVNRMPFE